MDRSAVHPELPPETERVATAVVDAAIAVHRALGPGLLESVYEACLAHELRTRGLEVETQVSMPVSYRDITLDVGLRLDMLVERCVIVEVKAVETIQPVHEAQLLTYLNLSGVRLGFLLNFNVPVMKQGVRRLVL